MPLLKPIKIGDLEAVTPLFASPLCGYSDRPKREMDRRMGCAVAFPQMVSAEGLRRNDRKTHDIIDIENEERPVGIQLFGSEPEAIRDSARIAEDLGASLVDINMGCPARKITGNNCGAALMLDPPRVARIIKETRKAITIPLTAKMRAGWDKEKGDPVLISRICQEEGAQWVTIHPRSRQQGFKGKADWSIIAAIKQAVSIPVIGNGDIFAASDALRMIRETGCDGIMVGRGGFGNPWIFRDIRRVLESDNPDEEVEIAAGPGLKERLTQLWRHARLMVRWRHPRYGMIEFRKHGVHYLKGVRNAKPIKQGLVKADSLESLRQGLNTGLRQIGSELVIEPSGRISEFFT